MNVPVVLSCEHASHVLPPAFVGRASERILRSHRGWDAGALAVAKALSRALAAPLFAGRVSRLLVDLNRSATHPKLSAIAKAHERPLLVARYHRPFRDAVARALAHEIRAHGSVLHLSIHSFTPVLRGERRNADLGLLYDPRRASERRLARTMQPLLRENLGARVRLNYPYRGTADGHTTALRRRFSAACYAGIELELNRAWISPAHTRALVRTLSLVLAR